MDVEIKTIGHQQVAILWDLLVPVSSLYFPQYAFLGGAIISYVV